MPNPFDAAMADPMDTAKMQAAADLLRRREAFATIGQLSGDPILGQFGQGEMQRVTGRRKSLREALDLRPTGTPGVYIQAGKLVRDEPYFARLAEEKEKDRQAALARAQVSGGNALSNYLARKQYEEARVPEATWRGPTGLATGISNVQNLFDVWQQSAQTPDFAKPGLDIAQETLGGIGLGGVGRWGEESFDLRSEPARGLRAQAALTLDRIRNSIFGSALTAYEISEGAKSNPLASGISTGEVQNRMQKLLEYLAGSARTMMAGRQAPGPAGGWQAPEWMDPNYQWALPAGGQETAPQATPDQMAPVPETGPGQTITPDQIPAGPVGPSQRTPQTMPKRPDGITDEEWQRYLRLEGMGGA